MPYVADRTQDTSTTTGTGALTLAGSAPSGKQTFATAHGSQTAEITVCIDGGAEWEVVRGIFNGTTGFSRDVVEASSNAGALVNFSAGTKNVFEVASAKTANLSTPGFQYAMACGFAMP